MIDVKSICRNLKLESARFGFARALHQFIYHRVNQLLSLRRLEIIYLTRDHLQPLNAEKFATHTSRIATQEELQEMKKSGNWGLSDELISASRAGDSCLLSFVGGKLAGYTWIHEAGRPRLLPGLRIRMPEGYLYNYSGFTHPDFRGAGLQPFRHHEILTQAQWRAKPGMIGYVDCTNWSSKRGQTKSGYQYLGTLTLIGGRRKFYAHFSADLKKRGMRRLRDE